LEGDFSGAALRWTVRVPALGEAAIFQPAVGLAGLDAEDVFDFAELSRSR